jgi:hypothetical protein
MSGFSNAISCRFLPHACPVAENLFPQLDDGKPGLGLTLKTEFPDQFTILE